MSEQTKQLYEFGPFRLDPAERLLLQDGKPVPLAPKVTDTLLVLIQNAGHLVEKDDLMKRVWQDAFVEEGNLNKNISILRKALGRCDGGREYIETIPKRGYRFVFPLQELKPEPSEQGQVASTLAAEVHIPRVSRKLAVAVIGGTLAIGLAVLLWRMGWRRPQVTATAPIRSLAVLPLENLSGDASQDYFADGMTDQLITDLGQIRSLRVISRTSTLQYKRTHKSLPQIARELNVDAVVEGTVMRSGERVRITAQLIQAVTDKHLWAHAYEGDLADVLTLQNQVAADISNEIRVKLTPQEQAVLRNTRIAKPAAYEAYFKGRYSWDKRTPEGLAQATNYFEEAIRDDPSFALPYAGLAQVYAALPDYVPIPPRESYGKAKVAATKALSLDDTLAEAHAALGVVTISNDYDWAASEREFERAIDLSPGYATAYHWHSQNLMFLGRWKEAIVEIEHARELDPMSIIINANIGFFYFHARRFDDAIAAELKALELDSNSAVVYEYLGLAYLGKKMYAEAVTHLRKAVDLSDGAPEYAAELSFADAAGGNRTEAQKILASLQTRARHAYIPSFSLAIGYTGFGDKTQALSYLQKAYDERCDLVTTIKVHPLLDSLRSDPKFQDLMRRVGLPQ
jgi:TolB-like protein/DNA-binding winged helix-turn-helix (wHTH) protein/Tfp pilus assembly protein PilF